MLSAGTTASVGINTDVLIIDLYVRSFSISGITSQDTKEVWRFPAALNGEIRTRR